MKSRLTSAFDLTALARRVAITLEAQEQEALRQQQAQSEQAARDAEVARVVAARAKREADERELRTLETEQRTCHDRILTLIEQHKLIPGEILMAEQQQAVLLQKICDLRQELGEQR
jgi:hypothetical protein